MERTKAELQAILKDKNADREMVLQAADEAIQRGILNGLTLYWIKNWNIKYGEMYDELIGFAWEGIARAMMYWKPGKSCFISYALFIIRKQQLKYIRDLDAAKRRSAFNLLYLDHEYGDDGKVSLLDSLYGSTEFENDAVERIVLEDVITELQPRQRKVIALRMRGYTQREVSEVIGVTQPHVNRILKQIKQEWQLAQ